MARLVSRAAPEAREKFIGTRAEYAGTLALDFPTGKSGRKGAVARPTFGSKFKKGNYLIVGLANLATASG